MDELAENLKDGLAFVANAIPRESVDDLYRTIFILFKRAFPSLFAWKKDTIDANVWYDQRFHNSILNQEKKIPKNLVLFTMLYN